MHQNGPLVGRDDELRVAEQALTGLQSPRSGVLEVTGEPGIGKTRLLEELTRTALQRGHAVGRGRAGERERTIAYGAVIDAVDPLLAELGPGALPGMDQAPLAAVFPSLPGPGCPAGPLLGLERYRLFAAVRAVLTRLSRRQRLVLVLDDLHWADEGTLELLGYLLAHPPGGPLLLVLAYRPRQAGAVLRSAIDTARDVTRIALGPLAGAAVEGMLERYCPGLAASARAELSTASGGNPCYLQALAGSSTAQVQRELEGLPAGAREMGGLASVIGEVIRPDVLAAVAGVSEENALAVLDEMAARDLVRETELPGQLRFRHPVLQQVAYDSIPPGRRLIAHRRTAAVLAARGVPLVERAHHIALAAAPGDATAAGMLAEAAAATLVHAPATAVRWYATALRLLPEQDPALLLAYAHALLSTGRLADAAETLITARSAHAADDPAADARLVASLGQLYNLLGQHDRAADVITTTLVPLPDLTGPESVALRLELAQVAFWRRDYPAMLRLAEAALTDARSWQADPLTADAGITRAFAEYQLGRTTSALGYLAGATDIVDALPDEALAGRLTALIHLGHTENALGRHSDALRHSDRGLIIARATGQGHLMPLLQCNRAMSLLYQGRLGEAAASADTALEDPITLANDMFRTIALLCRSWIARDSGDPVAAVRYGEQAWTTARQLSAVSSSFAGLYLAEAWHDLDAPERAISVLLTAAGGTELAPIVPPLRPRGYELLTRTELARGQLAAAQRYAELAAACPIAEFPRGRMHAARARAAVLAAQRRHHDAIAAATASVTDAVAAQAPVEIARSQLLLGRIQAAAGEDEQAIGTLRQAEADLRVLGVERDRDLAAGQLRALGIRPPRRSRAPQPRPSGTLGLSSRERQVARLVAAGRTNRQIGTQLHITENTVETHLKRIFTKLGVSSRASVATVTAATDKPRLPS